LTLHLIGDSWKQRYAGIPDGEHLVPVRLGASYLVAQQRPHPAGAGLRVDERSVQARMEEQGFEGAKEEKGRQ
jgi:hypothetical protein